MNVRALTTRRINLSRRAARCPVCGTACKRHSTGLRRLREVGISGSTMIEVTYSKHYCVNCHRARNPAYFNIDMTHLAPAGSRFTRRVRRTAVDMVTRQSMTLDMASRRMRRKYFVDVPLTTLHDWVLETTA